MDANLLTFLNQKVGDTNWQTNINVECPVCGDGIVNGSETCDEGNSTNGTAGHCNATCDATLPADDDEDGITNAYDNCPLVANPDQENTPVIFAKANAANRALS